MLIILEYRISLVFYIQRNISPKISKIYRMLSPKEIYILVCSYKKIVVEKNKMEMGMVQQRGCILAMGVMNFMCLGLMYSWSKFSTEIRGELGFNHAEITVAYSICMAMFTIGILMDGILGRWWESKKCVLAGILLAAGGYFATSFVPPSQGSLLYVTYGPIVGFGIGVVYNEWLHNIIQWFPDRSGMASGLLLLGMGLSGVTTTPLMAEVSSVFGWRCSFRIIAIMILLSGLLARR